MEERDGQGQRQRQRRGQDMQGTRREAETETGTGTGRAGKGRKGKEGERGKGREGKGREGEGGKNHGQRAKDRDKDIGQVTDYRPRVFVHRSGLHTNLWVVSCLFLRGPRGTMTISSPRIKEDTLFAAPPTTAEERGYMEAEMWSKTAMRRQHRAMVREYHMGDKESVNEMILQQQCFTSTCGLEQIIHFLERGVAQESVGTLLGDGDIPVHRGSGAAWLTPEVITTRCERWMKEAKDFLKSTKEYASLNRTKRLAIAKQQSVSEKNHTVTLPLNITRAPLCEDRILLSFMKDGWKKIETIQEPNPFLPPEDWVCTRPCLLSTPSDRWALQLQTCLECSATSS